MTYKKQNSRGKGGASHQGGWNAAHKLLSKEERDERRLESSQGKGHVLRKLQDQIRAASGKEEQLNGIRKAVELAFGFTAKLEQVDLCGLLYSTERIGYLSRRRGMERVLFRSFFPSSRVAL